MLIDDLIDPDELEKEPDSCIPLVKFIVVSAIGFLALLALLIGTLSGINSTNDFKNRECEIRGDMSARMSSLATDVTVDAALRCTDEMVKIHDIDLIVIKSQACVQAWQEAKKVQQLFKSPTELTK